MVATSGRDSGDPGGIGQLIVRYRRVGSTMEVASDLALQGAPHGTVVLADWQSAGRGRLGRSWSAAPGSSLLTSWIFRTSNDPETLSAVSPLVALAVARAMRRIAPEAPVAFKWPNDVLIDGRKAAGILLISRSSPEGMVVIAGIGVNLRADAIPSGAEGSSISEWSPGITTDRMLRQVSVSLGSAWNSFEQHRCLADMDLDAIHELMTWRGDVVTVTTGADGVVGIATGIGSDGSLLLQVENSPEITRLYVGEIVRGPRPARSGD
ncbi:hypothetical protein BH20CHL2_BH20CHL2_00320 [soil metagenome]